MGLGLGLGLEKLPTLSSIDPPALFLRSPAEEARTLVRAAPSWAPCDMRTDWPPPPPVGAWQGKGCVKGR